MPERPSADRTAEQLLALLNDPILYGAEARHWDASRLDPDVVLKLAQGRQVEFDDPALHEAENAASLRTAAIGYVQQVYFWPGASAYQTLGLEPDASAEAIKDRFRLVMQLVHPDRPDQPVEWPESFAAQANRAYATLRHPESRAAYDRERMEAVRARAMSPMAPMPAARTGAAASVPAQVLPEWLTAGVGGYLRRHPAASAFIALGTVALGVIAASMRDSSDRYLTRETLDAQAVVAVARAPSTDPRAPSVEAASRAVEPAKTAPARGTPATKAEASPSSPPAPPPGTAPVAKANPTTSPRAPPPSAGQGVPRPIPPDRSAVARVEAPPASPSRAIAAPTPPAPVPATAASTSSIASAAKAPTPVVPVQPTAAASAAPAPNGGEAQNVAVATPAPAPSAALPPAAPPLATSEIEAMFAEFVESYERGRLEAFAALFDDNADTNLRHGRAAIRLEYDELFRLSEWRKMKLTRVNWRRQGDRAYANGEMLVRIGWRDGREVEQRVAVDMELVRRDGRAVIAKLSHKLKEP